MLKPILFNGEMVKAILDGRKTVTRRIANINTEITCNDETTSHEFEPDNFGDMAHKPTGFVCRKCGFGVAFPHSRVPCGTSLFRPRYWPGDILYVRETWGVYCRNWWEADYFNYKADWQAQESPYGLTEPPKWRPSIHMPKEAARIYLRVKRVRVERLQKCGEGWCVDIEREGVKTPQDPILYVNDDTFHAALRAEMKKIWDSTIKPTDLPTYGWDANPWVWVIEFERISKEEAGCV